MSTADPQTSDDTSTDTPPPPDTGEAAPWHTATVSTLAEVERLLNTAEQEGFHEHELTVLGPDVFVVRWR